MGDQLVIQAMPKRKVFFLGRLPLVVTGHYRAVLVGIYVQKFDFFSTKDEVTKVRILKREPAWEAF